MTTTSATSADEAPEIVPELVADGERTVLDEDTEPAGGLRAAGEAAETAATAATADSDLLDDTPEPARAGSGVAAGAAAIAAAGLGLVSLSGSWLGEVLAQRQTLIGQIATAKATADAMIKAQYTNPWHKTAFVALGFAVAAVVVAAGTLFLDRFAARAQAPVWVRAVAWGALAIGVAGLGVSAAMYFDLFAGTITVPAGG